MSKSKEELNKIKEEVEAVNEKLQELTPEEIAQISGGSGDTGKNGCTGGSLSFQKCVGCSYFAGDTCTLSGKGWDC